jgi:type IV secretion system protein TrbG
MRLMMTALLAFVAMALAQQPILSPVQAKRLAPEKDKAGDAAYLDQYDFGAQVIALQQPVSGQSSDGSKPATVTAPQPPNGVPAGFKPKTDVQLTETAQEAVKLSEKWMSGRNDLATGRDGRVLYSYGAGLPTVVCAPLRVCIIELQAGERLVGEPNIGDSVRWNLSPARYGSGEGATSVIVLKPQSAGLDTNLLITTDRRAYYLRLLSKPEEYVARVAFAYPAEEENERKWREHLSQQNEQQKQATQIVEFTVNAIEALNFNYAIKGGDEVTRPVRVFDDGKKTYVQMNPSIKHREAPALVVIGSDGKQEMVNYRVKDDVYIVDRLFDRAALILGTGKKARKVEVRRERKA